MSSTPPDPDVARRSSLLKSLWFWVVLAFVILIGAWTTIITLALKNPAAEIDLDSATQTTEQAAAAIDSEAGE